MILVNRSQVQIPAILADQKSKTGGPRETERAIKFYKTKRNQKNSFPYKVYSSDAVKRALENLFHGKCAYCESNYMHVHPTDVEHWRPKGEVEDEQGKRIKPGYYWLAADWNNLFPSCIDCNRQRYHKVGNGNGEIVKLGKKNSFPLAPRSRRARRPTQEIREIPLLLNPCNDEPEVFLHFTEENADCGVLRAKVDGHNRPLAKAEASIKVYALNRAELVLERKKKFLEIHAQMQRVQEAANRVKNAVDQASRQKEDDIYQREMELLLDFSKTTKEYSLMACQILTGFFSTAHVLQDARKASAGK